MRTQELTLIGFGAIGRAVYQRMQSHSIDGPCVARFAAGYRMRCVVHRRHVCTGLARATAVRR